MNKVAIIQARMGSTRLPGKVLLKIMGKPMLWYLVERVKKAKNIDTIVVATSNKHQDKEIVEFCKKYNINYFQGSESDVLDRFYNAAKKYKADIIYRITGDCPLVDPILIDKLYELYQKGNFNHIGIAAGAGAIKEEKRFPSGLDTECFSFKVLEEAYNKATKPSDREHVTPYIWRNRDVFKIGSLKSDEDYSYIRLTVDNKEDFLIVKKIYETLYPLKNDFSMKDILNFFEQNQNLFKQNSHFIGKEGYEELWKN
jgi:spore coat polysaccharide biosynthesis protein SpsF